MKKATKKKKTNLISQAEYARRKGVSYTTIHKHVRNKKITLVDCKIDEKKADKQLDKLLDVRMHSKIKSNKLNKDEKTKENKPAQDFNVSRAKREEFNAKLAELVYEEKAGLLVSHQEVQDVAETTYRKFRDKMLNIPARISKQLAAESSGFIVNKMLKKEIELAIERFAK